MAAETSVFVIAIDGPAGSGKSTVARALAARLGLEYLDTGAMYRAVTFAAMRRGIPVDATEPVAALAREVSLEVGESGVLVDGYDATAEVRSAIITRNVSAVAANPGVRTELVGRQRAWARARRGGVLEGRDIGTVVFPDAALKVYLTASPRVRAQRRYAEAGGDIDEIVTSIELRDRKDRERVDGPLREARGAIVVDTSEKSIDEVITEIVGLLGPEH